MEMGTKWADDFKNLPKIEPTTEVKPVELKLEEVAPKEPGLAKLPERPIVTKEPTIAKGPTRRRPDLSKEGPDTLLAQK